MLVALRPLNIDTEREKFFQSCYTYNPQFEYEEPLPVAVLEKYKDASDQFITQVKDSLLILITSIKLPHYPKTPDIGLVWISIQRISPHFSIDKW